MGIVPEPPERILIVEKGDHHEDSLGLGSRIREVICGEPV